MGLAWEPEAGGENQEPDAGAGKLEAARRTALNETAVPGWADSAGDSNYRGGLHPRGGV